MVFYLATFLVGLLLDFADQRKVNVPRWRRVYLVWFFVFSCFGYMTGSDWRGYEVDFYDQSSNDTLYASELGFALIYKALFFLTHDYWLAVGILKCVYLYTLIRWLKIVTPYWMSILAITILNTDIFGLGFLLIDNPLRYMVATIFVNIAMELVLKRKYAYSIALMIVAVTCHNSTLFYLFLLIPFITLSERICRVNRLVLVVLYVTIIAFVSVADNLVWMKDSILSAVRLRISGFESYSAYNAEDTSTLFSIGSIIKYFLFAGVLLTRDYMVKTYENGSFLYGITICFYFFDRLLVAIPTGSRLLLFLNFFTVLYFILLLRRKHIVGYIYLFLTVVIACRSIWNSYQYIPYSNSIYYIFTEHKPFAERSENNVKAFISRTGQRPK